VPARLRCQLLQYFCADRRDGAHARQRLEQASQPDRLQQIIDRMQLERLQRIRIVRGGKDHAGWLRQLLQVLRNLHAIHLRHADVEQHHIGARVLEQLEQGTAVGCLRHHFERQAGHTIFQKISQAAARGSFVVGDHHP
jgi:hypothetical protein